MTQIDAAEYAYICDVSQGFNFQTGAQSPVVHINKLKVAGKQLTEDFAITDPDNVTGDPSYTIYAQSMVILIINYSLKSIVLYADY